MRPQDASSSAHLSGILLPSQGKYGCNSSSSRHPQKKFFFFKCCATCESKRWRHFRSLSTSVTSYNQYHISHLRKDILTHLPLEVELWVVPGKKKKFSDKHFARRSQIIQSYQKEGIKVSRCRDCTARDISD